MVSQFRKKRHQHYPSHRPWTLRKISRTRPDLSFCHQRAAGDWIWHRIGATVRTRVQLGSCAASWAASEVLAPSATDALCRMEVHLRICAVASEGCRPKVHDNTTMETRRHVNDDSRPRSLFLAKKVLAASACKSFGKADCSPNN
jgi:hypothetical protein